MLDWTGRDIGRYHVLEALGQGGMALVYKAYDTRLEREVAVKFIRMEEFGITQHDKLRQRFEREARALAKLTHPNIVPIIDFGEQEGVPYLVMPYLPGGTLKERIQKRMPYADAARLLLPVARGLDYAHRRGILHRDVKPGNVLITEDGEPMLSDFGVAKILESGEAATLTGTGVGVGTPEYMAPEQWLGKPCPQSDIYALGVVLYELVTGRRPYTADTPAALMIKHVYDPLPRPRDIIPELPDAVERVIFKALAKKPEERYATMADFAVALEGLGRGPGGRSMGVEAVRPAPRMPESVAQPVRLDEGETFDDLAAGAVGLVGIHRRWKSIPLPVRIGLGVVLLLGLVYAVYKTIPGLLAARTPMTAVTPALTTVASSTPDPDVGIDSPTAVDPPTEAPQPTVLPAPPAQAGAFQIPESVEGKFNVAMVLIGPHDDGGWSQAHFEGLEFVANEVENSNTVYIENVPENADSEQVFRALSRKGFNLIFGTSFGYMDPMEVVAGEFPHVTYINISGYKSNMKNFGNLFGAMENMKYLAGMLAGARAKMDGNPKLGYMATFPIPEELRLGNSIALGMLKTCPECTMDVRWINTWHDSVIEKEAAASLFDGGAQVVFTGADTPAVADVATEKWKWGVTYDWFGSCKADGCLTAPYWNWGPYYAKIAGSVRDGTYKVGWDYFDADSGALGLFGFMEGQTMPKGAAELPKDVLTQVKDLLAKTLKGEFTRFDVFAGEIKDNAGKVVVPAGAKMEQADLDQFPPGAPGSECKYCMKWWSQGITAELPQ